MPRSLIPIVVIVLKKVILQFPVMQLVVVPEILACVHIQDAVINTTLVLKEMFISVVAVVVIATLEVSHRNQH